MYNSNLFYDINLPISMAVMQGAWQIADYRLQITQVAQIEYFFIW